MHHTYHEPNGPFHGTFRHPFLRLIWVRKAKQYGATNCFHRLLPAVNVEISTAERLTDCSLLQTPSTVPTDGKGRSSNYRQTPHKRTAVLIQLFLRPHRSSWAT